MEYILIYSLKFIIFEYFVTKFNGGYEMDGIYSNFECNNHVNI